LHYPHLVYFSFSLPNDWNIAEDVLRLFR
jgi:hypothetical protein